jgi:hypothetical protein
MGSTSTLRSGRWPCCSSPESVEQRQSQEGAWSTASVSAFSAFGRFVAIHWKNGDRRKAFHGGKQKARKSFCFLRWQQVGNTFIYVNIINLKFQSLLAIWFKDTVNLVMGTRFG